MTYSRSECIDHGKRGNPDGYLNFRYEGKTRGAHRVAYCLARGITIDMIQGSVIRHTCDNPRCINPRHLLIGTQQDNIQDMVSRGRQRGAVGASNSMAKLTDNQVAEVRRMYVRNSKTHGTVALSKLYGVSQTGISSIVRGVTRV